MVPLKGGSGLGNTASVAASAERGNAVDASADAAKTDVEPSKRRRLISTLLAGEAPLDFLVVSDIFPLRYQASREDDGSTRRSLRYHVIPTILAGFACVIQRPATELPHDPVDLDQCGSPCDKRSRPLRETVAFGEDGALERDDLAVQNQFAADDQRFREPDAMSRPWHARSLRTDKSARSICMPPAAANGALLAFVQA